jgi:bifunctional oligoribonuclease and PAP phosphatase NrnA
MDLLAVPAGRAEAIRRMAARLKPGMLVAISTHVNADGDGCGSETALARLLQPLGVRARIVNPTPWPAAFSFLLGDDIEDASSQGPAALRGIDALVVMDINEVSRLGHLSDAVRSLKVPRLVIDHHIAHSEPAGDDVVADTTACATGELVYDFAVTMGLSITEKIAESLYVALLTDTGGFRFSNTTPRCHAIAGVLLASGVDPETMYRRVYASVPAGRLHLLREALESLGVDETHGLSWLSLTSGALDRHGVRSEELDGIVEHARSIAGTRLALFFRDLGHGKVKVSFRSSSDVDVNAFARRFGGGGHVRASGAMIAGSLEEVRERVLASARELLSGAPAAL